MSRAAAVLIFLAASFAVVAQQPAIDAEKLAQIRSLSPEERARLKARLEEIKKLSPEERERLRENLKKVKAMPAEEIKRIREKVAKLSEAEHKEYSELAGGFFKWAKHMGYQEGFPRGLFFQWLKREKPGRIEEIRSMEAGPGSPRVDEFIRLYHEFRLATQAKTLQHAKLHRCMSLEDLQALTELSPREYWPRWQELTRACAGRRAVPGPVAPRPLEPAKK